MNSLRFPALPSAFIAAALAYPAVAEPVTNWTERTGATPVSNMNTASPTVGNGAADSADARSIYASLTTPVSLAAVGHKVTLSGSATLTGISRFGDAPYSNQFRWGLFNESGTADTLGWLGYVAAQGEDPIVGDPIGGNLFERKNPNSDWYMTSAGSDIVATAPAPNTVFTDGTYNFTLTLERTSGGIKINSSIIRSSDSQQFGLISFLDTTPQTYDFNRVGLLLGNDLNADLVQFSNIAVTLTTGAAPSLTITSFVSTGSGIWEVALKGEPGAICEFRSSPSLDFASAPPVENLTHGDPGDPGVIGGTNNSRVTLDGNGNALVRMALPAGPKGFVRGQTVP